MKLVEVNPPNINNGKPSTIPILNILVPIIFPKAISNSPFLAAITVIVISGKDVPITTTVIVINLLLTFIIEANSLALSTTKSLENIISKQQTIVIIIDLIKLYFGLTVSSIPCLDLTTDINWRRDNESVLMGIRLLSVNNVSVVSNVIKGVIRYSTSLSGSFYSYAFVIASSEVPAGVNPIKTKCIIGNNIIDTDGLGGVINLQYSECQFVNNTIKNKNRILLKATDDTTTFVAIGNYFDIIDADDCIYILNYDSANDKLLLANNVFDVHSVNKNLNIHNEHIDPSTILKNNITL